MICHEGQIDNGHYTNFARFQDEVSITLPHFDRETQKLFFSGTGLMTTSEGVRFFPRRYAELVWSFRVTPTTLEQCLKASAYMCFYVKRHLDYKPNMTPSYVVTRETELAKEREREKNKEKERMKEVEEALLATV